MPGGSDYQGPADSLEMYTLVVNSSAADLEVKGAKNPYTSRNGHISASSMPPARWPFGYQTSCAKTSRRNTRVGPSSNTEASCAATHRSRQICLRRPKS